MCKIILKSLNLKGYGKKIKHYVFCPALLNLSFNVESSSQESSTTILSYRLKSICFHCGDSIKNGSFTSMNKVSFKIQFLLINQNF